MFCLFVTCGKRHFKRIQKFKSTTSYRQVNLQAYSVSGFSKDENRRVFEVNDGICMTNLN